MRGKKIHMYTHTQHMHMRAIIYLVAASSTVNWKACATAVLRPWLTSEPNAADIPCQTRLFMSCIYILCACVWGASFSVLSSYFLIVIFGVNQSNLLTVAVWRSGDRSCLLLAAVYVCVRVCIYIVGGWV